MEEFAEDHKDFQRCCRDLFVKLVMRSIMIGMEQYTHPMPKLIP